MFWAAAAAALGLMGLSFVTLSWVVSYICMHGVHAKAATDRIPMSVGNSWPALVDGRALQWETTRRGGLAERWVGAAVDKQEEGGGRTRGPCDRGS